MRDLVVLGFLIACIIATIKRPWWGVLALAVFSYLNPHAYAWGFMLSFPVYQTLFLVVFLAALASKDRQTLPNDWRIYAFILLWAYFFLTTLNALVPYYAWPRLIEVSKIYLPFILTLWMINTRKKLYYLVATIAGSFGLVAVKGGIWAIGSGFGHRVYGPPRSQYYENNAFAIATLIAVPLLILWMRETTNKYIKYGILGAIPLCFASALSSHSRGALLTIGVLVPVLIWNSRRKFLAIPVVILGVYLAMGNLPEHWFERMGTLQTYEEDASAQGRLKSWRDGWEFAKSHPILGAGFEGWRWVTDRDWHNSYIEILAEHGFIAFFLWLSLLVGSLFSLTRLTYLAKKHEQLRWIVNYSTMIRASLLAYAAGTVFLGLSYWDIFYHLVFISVLLKKFAEAELAGLDIKPQRPGFSLKAPETG